ncbi:MAG: hypothetical protein KAT77_06660 [Nanoarchaeota archaeon]|nr:hypothetical protein [Nanoarchaeota archaeon]
MTEVVRRELRRQEEKKAAERRKEKERLIQKRLIELIKKYNLRIKKLEKEVKELWAKEQKYISEGKNLRLKWTKWQRERKQRELEDLKKITPSIKFQ